MSQRLIFNIGHQVFMIIISGKEIYYNDVKHKVQMLYPEPSPTAVKIGGKPTPEEMNEYNMCKTEEELVSFVVRDCTNKGAKLIKREIVK